MFRACNGGVVLAHRLMRSMGWGSFDA